jgi:hypothetical protein
MLEDDNVYPDLDLNEKMKRCIEDGFEEIKGRVKKAKRLPLSFLDDMIPG